MLQHFVREARPAYLTTYTRNPRILRMIGRVSGAIYLLVDDPMLRDMAAGMNGASMRDVAYHLDRYGEDGLFHGGDPADGSVEANGVSLRQRYQELASVRNALVIAARVRRNG